MRILLVVHLYMEDASSPVWLYTGMLLVGCHLVSADALDEVLYKPKSMPFRFTKPFQPYLSEFLASLVLLASKASLHFLISSVVQLEHL